jgi:hypothetical protein
LRTHCATPTCRQQERRDQARPANDAWDTPRREEANRTSCLRTAAPAALTAPEVSKTMGQNT